MPRGRSSLHVRAAPGKGAMTAQAHFRHPLSKLDYAAINQALNAETLVPQSLPHGHGRGNEWVARNPNRDDRHAGSFTINLRTGVWKDFAGGAEDAGSDMVSLYAYLFHGNDQGAAAKELAQNFGVRVGDAQVRQ